MSARRRAGAVFGALGLLWGASVPAVAAPPRPAAGDDAAAEARARPRIFAAIVPAGKDDDGPPAKVDAALRDGIADGLGRGGVDLVDAGAGSDDVACAAAACLGALAERLGVAYLVRPILRVDDRDYALRLELYDARAGAVIDAIDERCALCSLAEARERIEARAAALVAPLTIPPAAAPRLTLTTTPAGARVRVDDLDLGLAPIERALEPGRHRLRASAHGHRDVVHEVDLAAGERADVHLTLTPIVRPPPPPTPRLNGWIPLAIGAPVTAAGITLAALDGSATLGCGTARGDCSTRLETTWPAAAALVAGAALTTLGAVLIHQARRARRARAAGR